jgi:CBS domain containing-hemolysin-like protein
MVLLVSLLLSVFIRAVARTLDVQEAPSLAGRRRRDSSEAVRNLATSAGSVCAFEAGRRLGGWWPLLTLLAAWVAFVLSDAALSRSESLAKKAATFRERASRVSRSVTALLRRAGEPEHTSGASGLPRYDGVVDEDCQSIVEGALSIVHSSVSDVMIPRSDVFFVDADARCETARHEMSAIGFSRAFVCEDGNLHGVVGIVHVKELRDDDAAVRSVARKVTMIPERTKVLAAIRMMQRERTQLALVISEYGEIRGLVAMEDLLEELVGEIYDESDEGESPQWVDGCMRAPGRTTIVALRRDGVELDAHKARTVNGFIQERLGRMARMGDVVEHGDVRVEVVAMKGLRVESVLLTRDSPA